MTRPIARPLALSTPAETPWTGPDSDEISARNDSSPSSPVSRISSSRLDILASQLTPTDSAVMDLVSSTRLCSGGQLERLFWPDGTPAARARRARRALQRLNEWRILDHLDRDVGGRRAGSRGYLYAIGPAGARLLDRRYGLRIKRLYQPGARFVAHTLAISELVVGLHAADRAGELDLLEVQTEPQCWRGFLGFMGARLVLKPDALVRIGVGAFEDRWFIEIDMDTESRGTLLVKAKRYLSYYRSGREQAESGVFPRVVWAAPTSKRVGQLAEVFAELGGEAGRLFVICRHRDLLLRLISGAAS